MITSMNLSAVKAICSWHYPAPYDIYDYMSFDEAVNNSSPLLQEENRDNYICFFANDNHSDALEVRFVNGVKIVDSNREPQE